MRLYILKKENIGSKAYALHVKSIEIKALALHLANPGSVHGTTCPQAPPGVSLEAHCVTK